MNKDNAILQILKIFGMYFVSFSMAAFLFSTFTPEGSMQRKDIPVDSIISILGIVIGTSIALITSYNAMQKAFQKTKSKYSNIEIYKDRTERLLEKANKVADKYMTHEANIHIGVAEKRAVNTTKMIRNAKQFQLILENYPDLKANQSIMELLSQIKESEDIYAQSKIDYNTCVEHFNTLIHCFPNNLLNKIFGLKAVEFYHEDQDMIITDEELGI